MEGDCKELKRKCLTPLTDKVRKRCQGRKASGTERPTADIVSERAVSRSESGHERGAEHGWCAREPTFNAEH